VEWYAFFHQKALLLIFGFNPPLTAVNSADSSGGGEQVNLGVSTGLLSNISSFMEV
jgi:hypothetical protein